MLSLLHTFKDILMPTWELYPWSRSSCLACSCAAPTAGTPPCCPPAWRCPSPCYSTWWTWDSSLYPVTALVQIIVTRYRVSFSLEAVWAGTPTGRWWCPPGTCACRGSRPAPSWATGASSWAAWAGSGTSRGRWRCWRGGSRSRGPCRGSRDPDLRRNIFRSCKNIWCIVENIDLVLGTRGCVGGRRARGWRGAAARGRWATAGQGSGRTPSSRTLGLFGLLGQSECDNCNLCYNSPFGWV